MFKNLVLSLIFIFIVNNIVVANTKTHNSKNLSLGGFTLSLHSEFETDLPFIGALGYSRYYNKYNHGYNLGVLGSIDYSDGSWSGSVFGFDKTELNIEIFILSGMLASDIHTGNGIWVFGSGLAFTKVKVGVNVDIFGYNSSSVSNLNGLSLTGLLAYTFYKENGGSVTFYTRSQGKGVMVGIMLGSISLLQ